MKMRRICCVAIAAIGMMSLTAHGFGLGVTFTWNNDCDCFCWQNDECWSYIGDPVCQYPNTPGDDVVIPAPAFTPASAYTILMDNVGACGSGLYCDELSMAWSVTFSRSGFATGKITATAIEIIGTSNITITVKEGLQVKSTM